MINKFIDDTMKIVNISSIENIEQRGYGDIIEAEIISASKQLSENYKDIIFIPATGKKSTADYSLQINDKIYKIDVKTHSINAKMSMPNISSLAKLKKEFFDTDEEFFIFSVNYDSSHENIITSYKFYNLYELNTKYLSIGNLGNGQLQIKNYKVDSLKSDYLVPCIKDKFVQSLNKIYKEFCDKQIKKFTKIKENIV